MNEIDREFARQAWVENDWDGHVDTQKLIQLVRAHEREECAKVTEKRVLLDDNKDKKIGYNHACKVIAEGIRARSKL
jgi:hypothetical protein